MEIFMSHLQQQDRKLRRENTNDLIQNNIKERQKEVIYKGIKRHMSKKNIELPEMKDLKGQIMKDFN